MTSRSVRSYLKAIGKKGGRARVQSMDAQTLSRRSSRAVTLRWMRQRFGCDLFAQLNIPGGDLVDKGLSDLALSDKPTPEALAVAELRPRLRFFGVPVPQPPLFIVHPRQQLYFLMCEQNGDLGLARFYALLEKIDSFCDALGNLFPPASLPSHLKRRWWNA